MMLSKKKDEFRGDYKKKEESQKCRWRRRRTKRGKRKKILNDTKFGGTHLDWFRFLNQFESQIGKCDLPQVSKFSYIKWLVIPKVRLLIDSLPFTSENYMRVKNIL